MSMLAAPLDQRLNSLTSQVQGQKIEIDTLRTRLQCLHDEVCRIDQAPNGGLDFTALTSIQNQINAKFDRIHTRIECMQDEVCRNSQLQKGLPDAAWISQALEQKADRSWVEAALMSKAEQADDQLLATLRTRLECLQDEVCRVDQGQKSLVDRTWVNEALRLKADSAWVDAALRSKAEQADGQLLATLRTRLECLQDEVCRIDQGQKSLADKAWVNEALSVKADSSWVSGALSSKAEQGDDQLLITLRTRLECLQDEVCSISQGHKNLADKAWVNEALSVKADFAWVDTALRSKAEQADGHLLATLRTRLECLQDEVCRIDQGQKSLVDKAWVNEALSVKVDFAWVEAALSSKAERVDGELLVTLRTRLECLQDEVCRIDQGQKSLADKAWVHEVLGLKADIAWVDAALRSIAEQGVGELLTTLRTRLECMQDEVCRIDQGQKRLAETAWISQALEQKADRSWVEAALMSKAEHADGQLLATLRTRLECLQDEVCRIDQGRKSLVDRTWVNEALRLKADSAWVDAALRSKAEQADGQLLATLRTRLECLQDEVCRINQGQKHFADKSWVASTFHMKDCQEKPDCHTRLQCLHDEVCRIDQRLKYAIEGQQTLVGHENLSKISRALNEIDRLASTVQILMGSVESLSKKIPSSESESSLQLRAYMLECSKRLQALIRLLIHLYKRGRIPVRRVGGGYEYEIGACDDEAVEALSALNADGFPLFANSGNQWTFPDGWLGRASSPRGSRSVSPGHRGFNSMYTGNAAIRPRH